MSNGLRSRRKVILDLASMKLGKYKLVFNALYYQHLRRQYEINTRISTILGHKEGFAVSEKSVQNVVRSCDVNDAIQIVHGECASVSSLSDIVIEEDGEIWEGTTMAVNGALFAACFAVERTIQTNCATFAAIRPPGHHAYTDFSRQGGARSISRGFCVRNNVMVAAIYSFLTSNVRNILLIDIDYHHGGGTQHSLTHLQTWLASKNAHIGFASFYNTTVGPMKMKKAKNPSYFVDNMTRIPYDNPTSPLYSNDTLLLDNHRQNLANGLSRLKKFANAVSYDLVIVSTGFDARYDDQVVNSDFRTKQAAKEHLWTYGDFYNVKQQIDNIAAKSLVRSPVFILEGGYGKVDLHSISDIFTK
jgi:acetoin utilization deacetylase AcuC-like enzyme